MAEGQEVRRSVQLLMRSFGEYKQVGVIGEGAFGKVYKALDKRDRLVAIKYIKFDNEEEGIPSSALRQISLLKTLKQHPNIVPLIEVQYRHIERELKIVFDYYDFDLKKYINQNDYVIDHKTIKTMLKKILNGVAYIHSKRVLHRDLKPQNILVDKQGNVKLADFGLARLIMVPQNTLTHQIETLWYRAPEVLLGQESYTYAVDMWAVGCIFAEMFTKKPLFLGNGCEIEQIFQIFSILGTPTLQYWPGLKKFRDFKPTFPKWHQQDLSQLVPQISEQGLDLLYSMLAVNPDKRINAADALRHSYLRYVQI